MKWAKLGVMILCAFMVACGGEDKGDNTSPDVPVQTGTVFFSNDTNRSMINSNLVASGENITFGRWEYLSWTGRVKDGSTTYLVPDDSSNESIALDKHKQFILPVGEYSFCFEGFNSNGTKYYYMDHRRTVYSGTPPYVRIFFNYLKQGSCPDYKY